MSATTKRRPAGWPGQGAFFVGFAFIVAATVLNIAHDRLPQFHMDKLPLYIGTLYAVSGKLGVTTLLVSLGLVFLVGGACYRGSRPITLGTASPDGSSGLADSRPYFVTGQQSSASTHSSGRVVLETWKYLTPPGGTTPNSP